MLEQSGGVGLVETRQDPDAVVLPLFDGQSHRGTPGEKVFKTVGIKTGGPDLGD
jgi:hypothetical protein